MSGDRVIDDDAWLVARLIALGLNPAEAERKAPIFAAADRAIDAWRDTRETSTRGAGAVAAGAVADDAVADGAVADDGGRAAPRGRMRWFVPGRIEVLGKHTDYAGGRSLICAVERGFCVTAAPRADDLLRVVDVVNQVEATLRVSADQPEETRWRTYPATVARRVARNFPPDVRTGDGGRDVPLGAASMVAGRPADGRPTTAEAGLVTHGRRLNDAPATLRGADLAFGSDLPRAAGVSSSTALVIAVFSVLAEINALDRHPAYRANIPSLETLAAYLGCVENGRAFGTLAGDRGVGTLGGSQDHTAILRAEPRRLVAYAYSPPHVEQVVALPEGLTFAIGSSGVAAEKTGAARDDYNRASQAAAAILDRWHAATDAGASSDAAGTVGDAPGPTPRQAPARRAPGPEAPPPAPPPGVPQPGLAPLGMPPQETQAQGVPPQEVATSGTPTLFDLVAHDATKRVDLRRTLAATLQDTVSQDAVSQDRRFPPEALLARFDHFVREALEIIPQATAALARGDLDAFGALVDESQTAAERWLANQIPETIALARLARARGAIAASSFGAGFGGSVWALVRTANAPAFLDAWQREYLEQFPAHADRAVFFTTTAGPPRSRL